MIDELNQPTTFEYDTGISIDLLAGLNADTADGLTVTVYDGAVTRTFELDSNDAITGGKWTTVRKMAEDCVDRAVGEADMTAPASPTSILRLHGSPIEGAADNVAVDQVAPTSGSTPTVARWRPPSTWTPSAPA